MNPLEQYDRDLLRQAANIEYLERLRSEEAARKAAAPKPMPFGVCESLSFAAAITNVAFTGALWHMLGAYTLLIVAFCIVAALLGYGVTRQILVTKFDVDGKWSL